MTWLQILAFAGVVGAFFGIGIAIAAYFNGKHIKEGVLQLREVLAGMDKNSANQHQDVVELQRSQHQDVVELLKGIVELIKIGFGGLSGGTGQIKKPDES